MEEQGINIFDVVMIMVAILQPIATALIGWMVVSLNRLNREVGELSEKIDNIVDQAAKESQSINRRFDDKKNKD